MENAHLPLPVAAQHQGETSSSPSPNKLSASGITPFQKQLVPEVLWVFTPSIYLEA